VVQPPQGTTSGPAKVNSTRAGLRISGRRIALVLIGWAVFAGLLIGVGELVVHSTAVQSFDRHITTWVVAHRSPALNSAMKVFTWLGSWVVLVVAGLVIALLVVRRAVPVAALLVAFVAWGGEAGAVALAKSVVQRDRPPRPLRLIETHGWSWPSGHTAVATLTSVILATIAVMLTRRRALQIGAVIAAVVVVAGVAFSRVELGVHWTTDVLASMIFVIAWLLFVWATLARDFLGPARLSPPRLVPGSVPHEDDVGTPGA
jgi:membrane-associated phospholipid phosphatase